MLMNINRMLKKARKEESGFTLIELIVVVVVIGILAAVAIPRIVGTVTSNANTQADNIEKQIVQSAVDRYMADNNGTVPANVAALVSGNYLTKDPQGAYTWNATTGKLD